MAKTSSPLATKFKNFEIEDGKGGDHRFLAVREQIGGVFIARRELFNDNPVVFFAIITK